MSTQIALPSRCPGIEASGTWVERVTETEGASPATCCTTQAEDHDGVTTAMGLPSPWVTPPLTQSS